MIQLIVHILYSLKDNRIIIFLSLSFTLVIPICGSERAIRCIVRKNVKQNDKHKIHVEIHKEERVRRTIWGQSFYSNARVES